MSKRQTHLRIAADPADAPDIPGLRRSIRVHVAAELLDCDESHIRLLLRQGVIEGHRLGKRGVRVYVDSIRAMQEGQALGKDQRQTIAKPARRNATAAHREALATLHKLGCL